MSRKIFILSITLILLLALTTPALAITYGEPDGNTHPNVGSIVLQIPGSGLFQLCSGTLISENVYLTASHCTVGLDSLLERYPGSQVLVTFDPTINENSTFYTGVWHTNPNYNDYQGQFGSADPGDVAVIVLNQAPSRITPARLPAAGLLDTLKEEHILKSTSFTAVGYGTVRDTNRTGFQGILGNLDRNRVDQEFLSLTNAWLTMSMNLATGNGGTCYGDSGGPHFIHLNGVETDIVASITVTGDSPCKATDKTYRMDTESARSFLGNYVTLP
jgi:secreted trypsin-like serine protease